MEDKFTWTDELVKEVLRRTTSYVLESHWQETIEQFKASKLPSKEYEILKMIDGDNWIHEPNAKGLVCNAKDNNCKIYSVKRLRDGEIFTIGDKVAYNMVNANSFIIDHFLIRNDGRMIARDKGHGMVEEVNDNLVKVNKLLFITEDGVSVTDEEQIVWYVDDRCKLNTRKAKNANGSPKCVKIYSKADSANEYVLLNKPCLSLNDLLSVWDEQASIDLYRKSPLFKNFKELAKSKINQK
jgi:hypothetical protein